MTQTNDQHLKPKLWNLVKHQSSYSHLHIRQEDVCLQKTVHLLILHINNHKQLTVSMLINFHQVPLLTSNYFHKNQRS